MCFFVYSSVGTVQFVGRSGEWHFERFDPTNEKCTDIARRTARRGYEECGYQAGSACERAFWWFVGGFDCVVMEDCG